MGSWRNASGEIKTTRMICVGITSMHCGYENAYKILDGKS